MIIIRRCQVLGIGGEKTAQRIPKISIFRVTDEDLKVLLGRSFQWRLLLKSKINSRAGCLCAFAFASEMCMRRRQAGDQFMSCSQDDELLSFYTTRTQPFSFTIPGNWAVCWWVRVNEVIIHFNLLAFFVPKIVLRCLRFDDAMTYVRYPECGFSVGCLWGLCGGSSALLCMRLVPRFWELFKTSPRAVSSEMEKVLRKTPRSLTKLIKMLFT